MRVQYLRVDTVNDTRHDAQVVGPHELQVVAEAAHVAAEEGHRRAAHVNDRLELRSDRGRERDTE